MDKIITLEELLNKHFKIINEAVENVVNAKNNEND